MVGPSPCFILNVDASATATDTSCGFVIEFCRGGICSGPCTGIHVNGSPKTFKQVGDSVCVNQMEPTQKQTIRTITWRSLPTMTSQTMLKTSTELEERPGF